MWQHRHVQTIAVIVGFVVPTLLGWAYGHFVTGTPGETALACFLLVGLLRTVVVQQGTFCINSLCHMVGRRPYSTRHSARDSGLVALLTFGEGYHNYHHEFQHDYRNGVKPWQFDPTKWIIWTLGKLGLAENLRTVPDARILSAEVKERSKVILTDADRLVSQLDERAREVKAPTIQSLRAIVDDLSLRSEALKEASAIKAEVASETIDEVRALYRQAADHLAHLRGSENPAVA
jgi:stearoyl-CoA desaturase (delta-9 desaturase)